MLGILSFGTFVPAGCSKHHNASTCITERLKIRVSQTVEVWKLGNKKRNLSLGEFGRLGFGRLNEEYFPSLDMSKIRISKLWKPQASKHFRCSNKCDILALCLTKGIGVNVCEKRTGPCSYVRTHIRRIPGPAQKSRSLVIGYRSSPCK